MILHGRVTNGVVVLQNGDTLPEGTEVTVRPVKRLGGKRSPTQSPARKKLLRHAGKAKGLPVDAARNLNHYLYGHPKE